MEHGDRSLANHCLHNDQQAELYTRSKEGPRKALLRTLTDLAPAIAALAGAVSAVAPLINKLL